MRSIPLIGVLFCLLSCGGPLLFPETEVQPPHKIPKQLLFEKEISGRLLAYRLQRPSGLAQDPSGNLYISDAGNHRLIKLDNQFKAVRDYGSYGSGIGRFHNPKDLVMDRGLNLYVLDSDNHRIVHLDANLNYIETIEPEDDSAQIVTILGKLSGLQISPLGELTVADYDNSRLIKLDNFNRFSRYVGDFGYGQGALLNPLGMTSDKDGRVYVADAGNSRIAVYDDYGNYLFQFGQDELRLPAAVAASPYGVIWVSDNGTRTISAYDRRGRLLMRLGEPGKTEYSFSDIEALTVSRDGRLFVADSGNNRILIYRIIYEDDN